jgi:UDP-N-acetylmuramoyl-tripeptide--D-alanyl-D-alanine ligase
MGELGNDSESEHQRIVDLIAECGFTNVWLVGERFSLTSRSENYRHFANVDEVKGEISNNKPQGLLILIKGSNSTKLFQLPELL